MSEIDKFCGICLFFSERRYINTKEIVKAYNKMRIQAELDPEDKDNAIELVVIRMRKERCGGFCLGERYCRGKRELVLNTDDCIDSLQFKPK